MAELVVEAGEKKEEKRIRPDWRWRLLNELFALFIALLFVVAACLVLLDSSPGHRFIVDQLRSFQTGSGLRIRIGRIDGSIFGKSQLHNVTLIDRRGAFLTAPEVRLDWTPAAWLDNRLSIRSLATPSVTLSRLPELKPSTQRGPILPSFDIHVGALRIDRLNIGPKVAGRARSGKLWGRADIHSGRALVDLRATMSNGGDKIALHLDSEPDRNRFDASALIRAPPDGIVPAILGLHHAVDLRLTGNGSWTHWRGTAAVNVSGHRSAALALGLDAGRYRVQGSIAPDGILSGKLLRLTSPVISLQGVATFSNGVLDGLLTAHSAELHAVAKGAVDLSHNRYDRMRLGVDLLKPSALFPNMSGKRVRMLWTLDGPFARADFSYRLTSDFVAFDTTGFTAMQAEGRGSLGPWPMRVPIRLSARAITGIGEGAGAMLANPALEGWLTLTPKFITGDGLRLTSAKWNGKLSLLIDLLSGRFQLLLSGSMQRYFIEGLGMVDVETDLKVVPGPGGRGSEVVGTAKAWVRRLDNAFFRDLTGGLPSLTTNLERGSDGIVRFTNLQLYSPKLRLSGSGQRFKDGTFHIAASGRQGEYGPLKMTLDGHIERPRIELFLEQPSSALGIRAMHLLLDPTAGGFAYVASGGSPLGPFSSRGAILLPKGATASVSIAMLKVADLNASGELHLQEGGLAGRLTLANGAIAGTMDFSPHSGAQQLEAHLTASDARFPGILTVHKGRTDAIVLVDKGRTTINGTLSGQGIEAAGITLAEVRANAALINGKGQVRAAVAGRRGQAFNFSAVADAGSDAIRLTGSGSVDRQPLVLVAPAVLTRSGDGWALAPTAISFGGGRATVSGRSGGAPEVHLQLAQIPLNLLDIFSPDLGLSGSATGHVDYAWKANRNGRLDLKVQGLSRAGLVLASKPIDVAVAAIVNGNQAAMRAVAASDGAIVGRAQARFAPLGGGPLLAELMNAPLFAQLRYSGPADTLWRLTGSEIIDMTGPLALGADVGGTLVEPKFRGSLRTQNARLESAVTGMIIDKLDADAHFSGPQLIFSQIAGQTSGSGSISGKGSVTFSGGDALLDLSFNANQALLLNRDDVAARVTGPLQLRSNSRGGEISGNFKLNKGRFELGRAGAASSVPQIAVHETGLGAEDVIEPAVVHHWALNLKVEGNDLSVSGLGITSQWKTNLAIGGFADAPRFNGRAELVQGNYNFAGRVFRLEKGVIRFNGENPPNPLLDIQAEAAVQGLNASVIVRGTGLKPEITFSSSPPLPQDELLSRILFGTSITNLSAPDALQLASALAALQSGSGSLDPINALRRAVGLDRLRIVPADVATGQKTAIGAGKYITRKLYVEVVTDGAGYSATQVEYQVSRWLSVLSTVSTIGRSSATIRFSKDY